jgi:hypothetical protein
LCIKKITGPNRIPLNVKTFHDSSEKNQFLKKLRSKPENKTCFDWRLD